MNEAVSEQPEGVSRQARVVFDDEFRELTGIAFLGSILMVLTLGIYRFWFITDVRKLLWKCTKIDDAPLEYTGRAMELLIGFLIALAILTPIYVLFFIASTYPNNLTLALSANLAAYVLLFVFGHFAIYRARRYRLNRTIWKGLRFRQEGSGWTFTGKAALWWLLIAVTLGLAYPWKDAALERYKINNTFYGNLSLKSSATGRRLFPYFLMIWLGYLGIVASFTMLIAINEGASFVSEDMVGFLAAFGMIMVISFIVCLIGGILYWARRTKHFISAISAGKLSFESKVRARSLFWPFVLFYLLAGIFFSVAGGFFAKTANSGVLYLLGQGGSLVGLFVLIGGYVVIFVIISFLHTVILKKRVWSAIANTITLHNLHVVDEVQAAARQDPSLLNQGLADAMDADFGVGF